MGNCEYVREYYGVPACIGRRVLVNGKPGVIAEDRGQYIGVNLDSDKPGIVVNAHPTWKVEYLDMGCVRQMTRSQQRYQAYLDCDFSECFDGFIDFCRHWDYENRKGRLGA